MEEKELEFADNAMLDSLTDKQKELVTVWKTSGQYLPCKRCRATGMVPEEYDEMDKLCAALTQSDDWNGSNLDWMIQKALDKHTIKKSKRGIFTSVLKTFAKEIEGYMPSAYE